MLHSSCPWSLYFLSLVFCFHTVFYEYHFINTAMTWTNAQQYCRLHYNDMATFTSREDVQRVKRPSDYTYAWIGLFDDTASWKRIMGNDSNSWRWSATETTSPGGYQIWEAGEPDFNSAANTCVMMRNGMWADTNCMNSIYFVCFRGSKEYILIEYHYVNLKLSWAGAQQYCREHYTDLATVENEEDVNKLKIPDNTWAWIGLFDDPASWKGVMTSDSNSWRWSSTGTTSPGGYQNWPSNDPNNYGAKELCVYIQNGLWRDYSCTTALHFFCYTGKAPMNAPDHI
uniref:C-type lectin domain-containing protein n=1 Tax=Periophthalmus magnuspinnatus TaxID=409849 RepID=A0A3B4AA24_9GOBI